MLKQKLFTVNEHTSYTDDALQVIAIHFFLFLLPDREDLKQLYFDSNLKVLTKGPNLPIMAG